MEKTNFCILLFVGFFTSLCNSDDYTYDDYNYNEYDYNNQNPEDYSDDYSQDLNDYYDQNLLVPTNLPLPPPPSPPMGKIAFFFLFWLPMMKIVRQVAPDILPYNTMPLGILSLWLPAP